MMRQEQGASRDMRRDGTAGGDDSPLVIDYYYDFTDTDAFCRLLEERFRAAGHDRPIEFVNWNCYLEPPGRDADLLIYDAVAMTALADKGFMRPLPDLIDTSDMFAWTIDKGLVRRKRWGVPLMVCANALICRREDDRDIRNIMDLREPIAVPLRTMLMYYYLQAFCNYQDRSDRYLEVMRHLMRLMGVEPESSTLEAYDGVGRFNRRECRYFLGFTESLREFSPGDYVVRFANFSEHDEDQMPLFMVDYASLGSRVRGDRLLDCLDLLEIMADPGFVFDVCTAGGRLQYMLPACRSVYPKLARLDPLYDALYQMLLPEENGVFRYGPRFYEEFYQKSEGLLERLIMGT